MGLRDLSFRKFRTEDARTVARIINSCLLEAKGAENQEEVTPKAVLTLSNKRKMYVVLNDDGKIIGAAGIDFDTIYTVFIDVEFQSQGVYEALIGLLEEIAANNGFARTKLVAGAHEQKRFEKLGYSYAGVAESNEFGQGILMEK